MTGPERPAMNEGPCHDSPAVVTVRYFAAAAEAAGTDDETFPAATLGEARQQMVERHGARMASVLARCSLLVNGARGEHDAMVLPEGAALDVLPPFAGG